MEVGFLNEGRDVTASTPFYISGVPIGFFRIQSGCNEACVIG
jgi:hypothetical protein